jgi:hypothetical protein
MKTYGTEHQPARGQGHPPYDNEHDAQAPHPQPTARTTVRLSCHAPFSADQARLALADG